MRQTRSAWQRYWPLTLAAGLAILLYGLTPILAPFVTAAVLTFILEPLVTRLARRGLGRGVAAAIVLLLVTLMLLALLLIIIPLFVQQLSGLYNYLPKALAWLRDTAVPWVSHHTGVAIPLDVEHVRAWIASHSDVAGQILQAMLPSLTSGGIALLTMFANTILLPVVLFYSLRDWPVLLGLIDELVPTRWQAKVRSLAAEVDGVLGEFLRGQVSVMLIMALLYSIGLWLTGLQSALPIGIIAGVLVFVPYLGVIIGMLLATLAAALQFQSFAGLLPVWGVFVAGQIIEGFFITPKLVGERVGLHPVAVIFALMAFGQLFGFVGILLALPLAATVLVGLRHIRHQYFISSLYRG